MANHDTRSIVQVLTEMKEELRDFISTRVEMLGEEMKAKSAAWKTSLPLLLGAIVLGGTALLVLSFALVAFAAYLIGGELAWMLGAAAVGALYLLVGGILGWFGYREISAEGLAPKRTLRVLKQDQIWIKNEARAA